jgi:hypothetical protein
MDVLQLCNGNATILAIPLCSFTPMEKSLSSTNMSIPGVKDPAEENPGLVAVAAVEKALHHEKQQFKPL